MKFCSLLLLMLGSIVIVNAQQRLQLSPAQPQPGATFTITYNTKGTLLENATDIEATAYLMEGNKWPLAKEVTLTRANGAYTGTVTTNDTTRAVFFNFLNGNVYDNRNDSGYYTLLYNKSGTPVPGAHLAVAMAYTSISDLFKIAYNQQLALPFFQQAFHTPAAKKAFRLDYWNYLAQSGQVAHSDTLRQELLAALNDPQTTEAELREMSNYFYSSLRDTAEGIAATARMKERFPQGLWQRRDQLVPLFSVRDPAKSKEIINSVLAIYGAPTKADPYLDGHAPALAKRAAAAGDYEAMETYAALIQAPLQKAMLYANVAEELAGESINNQPVNATKGKELAQKALALIEGEKKALAYKPARLTLKQWQKELQQYTGWYSHTYATNLYHAGEYEKAYAVQREAVEAFEEEDAYMNAMYTQIMEKIKSSQAVQVELEKFVTANHYTAGMKEQLKKIYLADNSHTEAQWTAYWDSLKQKALERARTAVATKMFRQPAPDFKLKDTEGKEVSLASLKGKVVVLDFWSTECNYCRSSFSDIQQSVEKYKSNPNVVFLFVNTMDYNSDRETEIRWVIAGYPFRVLYDKTTFGTDDFIMASNYGVKRLPTRFILDGNHNIRFKIIEGSVEEPQLTELDAMIEMAGNAAS